MLYALLLSNEHALLNRSDGSSTYIGAGMSAHPVKCFVPKAPRLLLLQSNLIAVAAISHHFFYEPHDHAENLLVGTRN